MWSSDQLNDEKMFKIVALVHDIDLNQSFTSDSESSASEIPSEEPSLEEVEKQHEIALRNFEAKQSSLDSGKNEFNHLLRQLNSASSRFDRLATELQERIKQESEQLAESNISNVVRDLQMIKADKAKELLLLMLKEGDTNPKLKEESMDEVIRLIVALPNDARQGILKKFTAPNEMQKLHEIHQRMLSGGTKQQALDDVKRQIQDRDFTL